MAYTDHIPPDIQGLYEIHDYRHAAAILANEFSPEFHELCETLREFRFTTSDIMTGGGNESKIPKKISSILKDKYKWAAGSLEAGFLIDGQPRNVLTHEIDYLKGDVAFDLEWNSKDQTFDGDLYAFSTFFNLQLKPFSFFRTNFLGRLSHTKLEQSD